MYIWRRKAPVHPHMCTHACACPATPNTVLLHAVVSMGVYCVCVRHPPPRAPSCSIEGSTHLHFCSRARRLSRCSRAALVAAPAGREDFDENQTGGVWGKYKEMNEGPQMGVPPVTLSSPNIPPHDFRRPLHLARGPPISHWPSTAPTDDEADISQLPL
jgi:hypothetical protein